MTLLVLAAVGVAVGAALQSATGFGFSLVAAPLLFAAIGPAEAVGMLIVLGLEVNLLTIGTERRRPAPLGRETARLLAWSLPGALAGVALLRSLSPLALQIALTAGVVGALLVRGHRPARAPAWAAPLAGFAAGALTTSTTTSGPPLLAYLLGRGHDPGRLRDTLTLCFLALSPIGAAALIVTGTAEAWPDPLLLAALVPVVVAGHLAGRPLFARLARGGRYEPVLTVALLCSVAVGLVGVAVS
jgi:uncharacterized membrane protein YfcA